MMTTLRRLFLIAVIAGCGYAVWSGWRRRQVAPAGDAPVWPPLGGSGDSGGSGASEGAPAGAAGAPSAEVAPEVQGFATASAVTDEVATESASSATEAAGPVEESVATPTWVEPVDGACPVGYPIKANDNSGIYHVPGGRFYDRTAPERCYSRAEDAEADGYRAAKA